MSRRRPVVAAFVLTIALMAGIARDGASAAEETVVMVTPLPPPPRTGRPEQADPFPQVRDWASLRMRLHRNGCGEEYWVTIYGTGTVDYDGVAGVLLGRHRGDIAFADVQALVDRFRAADYFRSWDLYGHSMYGSFFVTDSCAAGAMTTISFDGHSKTVEGGYVGNSVPDGMPPELAALPDAIDDLATRFWLKPTAATIDALAAEPSFHGAEQATAMLPDMIRLGADAKTVRRLIAFGARPGATEQPLVLAANRIDPQIVSVLIEAGGNRISTEVLDLALVATSERKQPMWGARWPYGEEPEPDRRARLATLRLLLDAHADANSCTEDGTPLARGVEFPAVVALLLAAKADPNQRCKDELPLSAAADSPNSTRLLLAAGANPRLRDADGRTVYANLCAKMGGFPPARSCKTLRRWIAGHRPAAL